MAAVYKRAGAKRDLVESYVYLAEHAGIETAERFLSNAGDSFSDLSRNPAMGVALFLRDPRLAGLRKWRINGSEKCAQAQVRCAHRNRKVSDLLSAPP
jgi:toxin ParE1/3/4